MKKTNCVTLALLLFLSGFSLRAETIALFGHISMTEAGVQVHRAGVQEAEEAIVNLPLLGGDSIRTSDSGRCEIQSDNGTIVRLDHNSELELVTVLAPSLTSTWKITTLKLLRGGLYIINNTYKREMAQVQTANAAVKLRRDCRTLIAVAANGDTSIRMLNGRSWLLYGSNPDGLQDERIAGGQSLVVNAANQLQAGEKVFSDFLLWNEGIDRHFDALHKGLNKLPKPLQRYSPALVYWAEKWSSRYGEWIWNDLCGYVWRPYADSFVSQRPFFNANWRTIHGRRFLVPQEPWGWAPAYLGTWHWLGKHGWVWIPGNFGYSEPWYMNLGFDHYGFFTLCEWYNWDCGRTSDWFFRIRSERKTDKSGLPDRLSVPTEIKQVMRAIAKLPDALRRVELEDESRRGDLPNRTRLPVRVQKTESGLTQPALRSVSRIDWNPDTRWAQRVGAKVEYRAESNEFVCAELHLSSQKISAMERSRLQEMGQPTRLTRGHAVSNVPAEAVQANQSGSQSSRDQAGSDTRKSKDGNGQGGR